MAHQTDSVTLTITWDNEEDDHPLNWDWPTLLDMDPDNVEVTA